MTFLKLIAVLFLFLSLGLSLVLVSFFGLKRFRIHPVDLFFPLLAVSFYIVSDQAFYHSLIPILTLVLSIILLGVSVHFIRSKETFPYQQVVKIFWRIGFIFTLALYLALLGYIFIFA